MKAGWELKKLGDVCEFDKSQGLQKNLPYPIFDTYKKNIM